MTREEALEIIKEASAVAVFSQQPCKYKTVDVLEAVNTFADTIDQLKKARKAARRYKRMYLRLKTEIGAAQCKDSEKIVEE